MTVVRILFLQIHWWICVVRVVDEAIVPVNVRGGGGGLGRADSGIHEDEERASRSVLDTFSRCRST